MMVLILGVSLTDYIALRFVGQRYGVVFLDVMRGLIFNAATTWVFARHSRQNNDDLPTCCDGDFIGEFNRVSEARVDQQGDLSCYFSLSLAGSG
jgi:hypothetical protein